MFRKISIAATIKKIRSGELLCGCLYETITDLLILKQELLTEPAFYIGNYFVYRVTVNWDEDTKMIVMYVLNNVSSLVSCTAVSPHSYGTLEYYLLRLIRAVRKIVNWILNGHFYLFMLMFGIINRAVCERERGLEKSGTGTVGWCSIWVLGFCILLKKHR